MSDDLARIRRDWEDGHRRYDRAARDAQEHDRLSRQFEVVSAELRRRVGSTFTLEELGAAYAASDSWTRQAIEEYAASPGWVRTVSLVGDAAFHVYARGAVDYLP